MDVLVIEEACEAPGFWYVGTPYSRYAAGHEAAFAEASRITAALMKAGLGVFSPIAHTHPIAVFGALDPTDLAFWLSADRFLMDAAQGLIVVAMEGWRESAGLQHEIEVFAAAGKPIRLLPQDVYEPLVAASRMAAVSRDAEALCVVAEELRRARQKFGPFASQHEGYAVIAEELDELFDAVKCNSSAGAVAEAVQVAAMGARFVADCS